MVLRRRADNNALYTYIMGGKSQGSLPGQTADYRLPAGVTCAGGCVLQWEYFAMQVCAAPQLGAGYLRQQQPRL